MQCSRSHVVVLSTIVLALIGCGQLVLPTSAFHKKFHWKAEEYFTDPQVIALCKAIEANDIAEIDRLVAAGADVNAQGKGKMTPLLWAYPDNKLDRFKRLLEHGANPNVLITSDLGVPQAFEAGISVTHLATKTNFPGYFEAVFAHGGDPNIAQETKTLGRGTTPLFIAAVEPFEDRTRRIRLLLDMGANVNHAPEGNETAAKRALGYRQFDIVLMLLEAGADPMLYEENSNRRLVHALLTVKNGIERSSGWSPKLRADYDALVRWFETHGESVEEARKDQERWKSWSRDTGEYDLKMAAEVAARKERDRQAQQDMKNVAEKDEP